MSIGTPWDPKLDRAGRNDATPNPAATGPVLHEIRSTGLTYETFYGLKEKPFSLSSDSRFFYHSQSHAPAYEDLLAGIRRRESLSVLSGDIGTGKTTLCRTVLQNLDRKTFSAFVPDPFASREDLLKVVLMDFGVLSVEDLTSGRLKTASRTELSYLLYDFLGTLAPLQAFAVVIIDEAQNLSVPLLEEIRILSDSDGRERQLQVVLVGQLELRQKLKLPEMRQVDQRVSVHCHLAALDREGVAGYIAHRLQVAGGSPDRVRFSPEAVDVVYRISGGVPRLINRLCDRALAQGYLKRACTIDPPLVEAAIPDAGQPAPAVAVVSVPISVMAPPRTVSPSVPGVPLLRGFHDPVDDWLTVLDEQARAVAHLDVHSVRPAGQTGHAAPVVGPDTSIPLPVPAGDLREQPKFRTEHLPRTHMQRITSRWVRRLGIAAMWVMGFATVAVGATSLWTLSSELTAAVEVPALPPERHLLMALPLEVPRFREDLLLDVPAADQKNGARVETPR
jgi:type II secretory pathway predicted ATPase ExeA